MVAPDATSLAALQAWPVHAAVFAGGDLACLAGDPVARKGEIRLWAPDGRPGTAVATGLLIGGIFLSKHNHGAALQTSAAIAPAL